MSAIAPVKSPAANDNDLLTTLLTQMQEAMVQVDLHGQVIRANSAALALLGVNDEELIGQSWLNWLTPPWQEQFRQGLGSNPRTLSHAPAEMLVRQEGDLLLPVMLSVSYLATEYPSLVLTLQDISHHKAELAALQKMAATDYLTGLANRRTFMQFLDQQWDNCTKKKYPISVIMVDVDYFKLFNDQFGHLQGDECLKRVAAEITRALPNKDCLAARYGGEEFAVVLPRCNQEMAQTVANVIRRHINNLCFTQQGLADEVQISVSQGLAAEFSGQFRTADAMLFAADTALYRAKTEGRDRINMSC
ncbi:GGDEF domain-containing protein [Gallaecimonas sp. GXIMD1310]|uniref:GGDEF domain-containing protein n=1 Tax=Gallaecimonas sp. GXIMD1310 TaxID=3131926 RepID=UPI00324E1E50